MRTGKILFTTINEPSNLYNEIEQQQKLEKHFNGEIKIPPQINPLLVVADCGTLMAAFSVVLTDNPPVRDEYIQHVLLHVRHAVSTYL